MNAYRIILIALLALTTVSQASQAPPQGALASIRGVVIDAATNRPVSGAVVELTGIERGRVLSRQAISGKDGAFELHNLQPASDYQLTASENDNYMPGAFGQHSQSDPWSPVSLAAGQNMSGVRLVLTPISSITGKVVDGAGKPLSNADVYVLRATYAGGRRVLQQERNTKTNYQGEYFIGRLGSGQYYVRANPVNSTEYRVLFENPARWDSLKDQKIGEPEGFPTAYYPDSTDLASARPIDLLNGGKVRNINIVAARVRTHRVGGTVMFNANDQTQTAARALLVPRSAGPESSFTRSVAVNAQGQFEFRGVLPGSYYLIAVVSTGNTQLTARSPVDVRDADLQKLTITADRGFDIPGTIRFADWQLGAPPDYSQLAINLVPDTTAPVDRTFTGYRVIAKPLTLAPSTTGDFVLKGIAQGDYRIFVSLNPKLAADAKVPIDLRAAYVTSVQLGTTEIIDGGMHVDSRPEGGLQIVIATNSGSIFGRVLDEKQEPVVPARMVLVPEKAHRRRFDLFSLVSVSTTGRFSLDGIPPGDYKLFAWAHVEDGAWLDPEFMRVYEDRGTPIHIEESGSYPIEIPLIY